MKKLYEDPSSITADEMEVVLGEMTEKEEVFKYYNDFVNKLVNK